MRSCSFSGALLLPFGWGGKFMADGTVEALDSSIVVEFRERARGARRQAYFVLSLICALLVVAVVIFIFAGELTRSEVGSRALFTSSDAVNKKIMEVEGKFPSKPTLSYTKNQVLEYRRKRKQLQEERVIIINALHVMEKEVNKKVNDGISVVDRGHFNIMDIIVEVNTVSYWSKLGEDGESGFGGVTNTSIYFNTVSIIGFISHMNENIERYNSLKNSLSKMNKVASSMNEFKLGIESNYNSLRDEWFKRTSEGRKEVMELRRGLKLVAEKEFKEKFGLNELTEENKKTTKADEISIPILVQTTINRFGPLIVILFFASILVNLYRYSIRLSAYYDARADAVHLVQDKVDVYTYSRYIEHLSPDELDVGKPPKLPTSHLVDIAKAVVAKMKSG